MFSFRLGPPAERFLKKCENDVRERIIKKIRSFAEDPFPSDSKRILGRTEKMFRVRVGDYRILFFRESSTAKVYDVSHRHDVYKGKD